MLRKTGRLIFFLIPALTFLMAQRTEKKFVEENSHQNRDVSKSSVFTSRGLGGKSIIQLCINPVNPSIIIAVTTRPKEQWPYHFHIFKSEDAGVHWRRLQNGLPPTPIEVESSTNQLLAMNPINPSIFYLGYQNYQYKIGKVGGLYRSIDGGETWSKISSIPMNRLVINPRDPSIIYGTQNCALIDIYREEYDAALILKSLDSGLVWDRVFNWDIWGSGLVSECTVFAVCLVDPNRIYAVFDDEMGGSYRSYFETFCSSDDGGVHWDAFDTFSAFPNLRDFYDISSMVFQPGTSTLFCGWREKWPSQAFPVFKTGDGGKTWRPVGKGLYPGVIVHCLMFDPWKPSMLYAGTNRELFSCRNEKKWILIGLENKCINCLAYNKKQDLLYAGTDKGVWCGRIEIKKSDFKIIEWPRPITTE